MESRLGVKQVEMSTEGEEALLASLAEDLEGNFERLVVAYQDRMYRFALRLAGNRQEAEELAQDALVQVYRALSRYSTDRVRELALRPWLYRIVLNLFRNRLRRRHTVAVPLEDGWEGVPSDRWGAPEPGMVGVEWRMDLEALLAALPERYRVPVLLRHVEGLSYRELAALLGQPVGTAKANVHRGLRRLRMALIDTVGEGSGIG